MAVPRPRSDPRPQGSVTYPSPSSRQQRTQKRTQPQFSALPRLTFCSEPKTMKACGVARANPHRLARSRAARPWVDAHPPTARLTSTTPPPIRRLGGQTRFRAQDSEFSIDSRRPPGVRWRATNGRFRGYTRRRSVFVDSSITVRPLTYSCPVRGECDNENNPAGRDHLRILQ